MFSGITKQALRRHRSSLLGPAITQMMGACIISAMIMVSVSINNAVPVAQRVGVIGDVLDSAVVFLGTTIYMAIAAVGVTMHIAMLQQMRDIALLRSVGATPGQVRRCLIRQAGIITFPAVALGYLLAIPAAAFWLALLKSHAGIPTNVQFSAVPSAFFISLSTALSIAIVGTFLGVLRTSRRPSNTALVDSQTGNRPISRVRLIIGTALVFGGMVASAALAQLDPKNAGDSAITIIFAECIGVGMLTPYLLHVLTKHASRMRLTNTLRLAVDDLITITRPLSGAIIPLVLAIAFAGVQIATIATMAHFDQGTTSEDAFTTYSGTLICVMFAAIAALNCLITLSIGRRRNLAIIQLAGGSRRQIMSIFWVQSLVVAAFGLVLGSVIACVTLFPLIHQQFGAWMPYLSLNVIVGGIIITIGMVALGLVVPSLVLTRKPPIEVLSTRD
jgi:putative ABC transport system permease protein